jgi:hypothetical protein
MKFLKNIVQASLRSGRVMSSWKGARTSNHDVMDLSLGQTAATIGDIR